MSQVSSDFDEPLLDDDDLVGGGDFGDGGFDDGLGADGVEGAWQDTGDAPVAARSAPIRKQGFSIYTVMLIMSFVFLTTAAILIFMELGRLK